MTLFSLHVFGNDQLEGALSSGRFTQIQRDTIRRLFQTAEEQGIDAEILLPRIHEAVAKNIPGDRLAAALLHELERLEEARAILLETSEGKALILEDSAWQRTANMIAWGATNDEIKAIAVSCKGSAETFIQATHLFVSLIDWGVDRDNSRALVITTIGSSINIEKYPGILELLIQGRRLMLRPHELISRLIQELPNAASYEQLKKKVLYE